MGLLERERELARIEELLDGVGGGSGRLLLISGPGGIGKTSLLQACGERALSRGWMVSQARGDELVLGSSFAVVRELLAAGIGELGSHAFDGAARLAAPVFEGEAARDGDRDRVAAVLHGLYWLVADLTERGPVVLLVDDAHWLDLASARFLIYLARRLESLPVLLAVGARAGVAADPAEPVAELSALAASSLPLAGLSEEASAVLVRRGLGARADQELCRSCHEATGGNPFYLRELVEALRLEGRRPTVEVAESVRALGSGAVGRSVLVRVARLGADCELVAAALAVLAPGSPLRHAAVLAGLDRDRAEVAADALRATGVLAPERGLSFAHPILREAVTAQLAPSRRARLHGEAARLLLDDGASSDEVAAHLLSAEPYGQAWVVEALRAAARQAVAHGAPEAAVSYLRRALLETPVAQSRLQVLIELGRAEALLPVDHDFTALREALELTQVPQQRAEIAYELALALFGVFRNVEARALLAGVFEHQSELDPGLVELLEQAIIVGGLDDLPAMPDSLARATKYFERAARGEALDPRMLAALAAVAAGTGMPAPEVISLARRALNDERLLDQWLDDGFITAAEMLCWADQPLEAVAALDRGAIEADRRGSAPMLFQLACVRVECAWRLGDLDAAEDYCGRALQLGRELGAEIVASLFLPLLHLERGRPDEAVELITSLAINDAGAYIAPLLAHRGRVRVAIGEHERGLADLLRADRLMSDAGSVLSIQTDWVPAAVAALVRSGSDQAARELAGRELKEAAAFGSARRHGIALSTCGKLDPGPRGLAQLRRGVETLERSPARLEHTRALINLGIGLHARGRREEARDALSRALDLADRCGAVALGEQARAELVVTGARPRRRALTGPDSLTPAELRTARMAAEGLTNRQIAQALFVSTKAVEAQLSQAYAKLAIPGRAELPGALGKSRLLPPKL